MYNSQDIPIQYCICCFPIKKCVNTLTNQQLAFGNNEINPYFIQSMQGLPNQFFQPQPQSITHNHTLQSSQSSSTLIDYQKYALPQQSTMPSLLQKVPIIASKESKKKNFPMLLTRKIAKQVNKYLMNLPSLQKNKMQIKYLSFWLLQKKQTKMSLQQFLIGRKDTSLTKQFAMYLSNGHQEASLEMNQYREYFRKFISRNKETILQSAEESKTKQNLLFLQYARDFIQDLQQSKMRGKAKKLFRPRE